MAPNRPRNPRAGPTASWGYFRLLPGKKEVYVRPESCLALFSFIPAASPGSEGFGAQRQNASTPPLRASRIQEQVDGLSFSY